jgi:Kef-type K+ transport system membrane component KefB
LHLDLYDRFSITGLAVQLVELAVFVPLILFGLSRVGSYALSKVRSNEDAEFVLMLGIMATAGVMADFINLPGIVGAFLAGLAVNAATRERAAKAKLDFFGKALFIPCFFVATGFLIDPVAFVHSVVTSLPLVAGIVVTLMLGKWIAAEVVGRAFNYLPATRLTIWSLTLPQVAATLAAALVAYHTIDANGQRLLDERMLNAVLVLMLATSILGPILTERFAPRMLDSETEHSRVVAKRV